MRRRTASGAARDNGRKGPRQSSSSDWEGGVEVARSAREEALRRQAGEAGPPDAVSQLRRDAEAARRQETASRRQAEQQALERARRAVTQRHAGRRDDDREPVFETPGPRRRPVRPTPEDRDYGGGNRVFKRLLLVLSSFILVLIVGIVVLWQYLFADFRARNRPSERPRVTTAAPAAGLPQPDGREDEPPGPGTELPAAEPIPAPERFVNGIQNILLIGSDTRNDGEHDLADTLLILTIDNDAGKLRLSSIQRDTAVYISGDSQYLSRINASMHGGPGMVMETVNRSFSLDISDFVAIEFTGVEDIIDALGGIEVDVPEDESFIGYVNDAIYEQTVIREGWGYEGPSQKLERGGLQLLSGRQALGYMRVRKSDSDYQRTGRQREVLQLLLDKFMHQDLVTMLSVARQGLGLVRTNLSEMEMLGLATSVLPRFRHDMEQLQIPLPGTFWERQDGMILPGYALMNPRIHDFIYGSHQYLAAVREIPAAPKLETVYWLEPGSDAFRNYYRSEFGDLVDAKSQDEESRQRQAGYVPSGEGG
ncbi:MAG: LCP family protein [Bacillota bacterium]|nr:LCP family protein [Bacillota bacterium]